MGRRKREHRQAVAEGKAKPFRQEKELKVLPSAKEQVWLLRKMLKASGIPGRDHGEA